MNSTSESLLLRLRKANDHNAWSRFVRLYTPLIFYWARRTGLSTDDAADLVQDVLTIVFQKLPGFVYDPDKSFRGWLRMITLNKHREHCSKKRLDLAEATRSALANIADPNNVAESTWDLNYQQELIGRALDLLQDEFRPETWAALKDYVINDLPAADVASKTGLSVWTIYTAKSRLMRRLREELDGLLE